MQNVMDLIDIYVSVRCPSLILNQTTSSSIYESKALCNVSSNILIQMILNVNSFNSFHTYTSIFFFTQTNRVWHLTIKITTHLIYFAAELQLVNSFGLYASPRGGRREAPSRNETRGWSQLGDEKWKSPRFSENYFVKKCLLILKSKKAPVFLKTILSRGVFLLWKVKKPPFFWKLFCQEVSSYCEKWKSPRFLKTVLSRGVFLLWKVKKPPFFENYFVKKYLLILTSEKDTFFWKLFGQEMSSYYEKWKVLFFWKLFVQKCFLIVKKSLCQEVYFYAHEYCDNSLCFEIREVVEINLLAWVFSVWKSHRMFA